MPSAAKHTSLAVGQVLTTLTRASGILMLVMPLPLFQWCVAALLMLDVVVLRTLRRPGLGHTQCPCWMDKFRHVRHCHLVQCLLDLRHVHVWTPAIQGSERALATNEVQGGRG